jgi:hypothetical protein
VRCVGYVHTCLMENLARLLVELLALLDLLVSRLGRDGLPLEQGVTPPGQDHCWSRLPAAVRGLY